MDYSACEEGMTTTQYVIIAMVIILILLVIYYPPKQKEPAQDRITKIIDAVNVTMRTGGNIVDFRRSLGDRSFDATVYPKLTELYRKGTLTPENVGAALS